LRAILFFLSAPGCLLVARVLIAFTSAARN